MRTIILLPVVGVVGYLLYRVAQGSTPAVAASPAPSPLSGILSGVSSLLEAGQGLFAPRVTEPEPVHVNTEGENWEAEAVTDAYSQSGSWLG